MKQLITHVIAAFFFSLRINETALHVNKKQTKQNKKPSMQRTFLLWKTSERYKALTLATPSKNAKYNFLTETLPCY